MASAEEILVLRTLKILDASIEHYHTVKGDQGLREAFHESGEQLCLTKTALEQILGQLGGFMETDGFERTISASLSRCKTKAEITEKIFRAVAQAPETSRFEKYKAAVRQESKGSAVEILLIDTMVCVRAVAEDLALQGQVKDLDSAIERLSDMEPSVPGEGLGNSYIHHGLGDMNNAPGGEVNTSKGSGNQFPGAKFGTVYFGSKDGS